MTKRTGWTAAEDELVKCLIAKGPAVPGCWAALGAVLGRGESRCRARASFGGTHSVCTSRGSLSGLRNRRSIRQFRHHHSGGYGGHLGASTDIPPFHTPPR